ncbi:MAG: signal peptidase I [Solirubrobacterales bacterium]
MRLRAFLAWAVASFVLAVLLAAALPLGLGGTSMVVRSGSMTPAIRTGDVVVVRPMSPTEAAVGDIVTFKDPAGSDRLLVHRVRAISRSGDEIEVITRGDANTTQERWKVAADGTIGAVLYRVPALGFAVSWIGSPAGRVGLVIVPALLLIAMLLMRIWRPLSGREGLG